MRQLLEGNFTRLAHSVDFSCLLQEIEANEELFNECVFRQNFKGSPFKTSQFIPLRMSYDLAHGPTEEELIEHLTTKGITNILAHDTEYYAKFPSVYSSVMSLASIVKAEQIGRVLITRLQAGGHIGRHKDFGEYHDFYDRFHLVLAGKGCHFRCGQNIVEMLPGEIWWFYNNDEHEVWNDTDADRIHVVVDFKLKGPKV